MNKAESILLKIVQLKYPGEPVLLNYRPDWLKNPATGYNLELDLYLPNQKLGIEVNGLMHKINEAQMKRDALKKQLCEQYGVKLLNFEASRKGLKQARKHFDVRCPIHYRENKYLWGEWGKEAKSGSHYNKDKKRKLENQRYARMYEIQRKETEGVKKRRDARLG